MKEGRRGKLKDEIAIFLTILAAFVSGFIPYFLTYLTLQYAIITFLLTVIVLTDLYFMRVFQERKEAVKPEKCGRRKHIIREEVQRNVDPFDVDRSCPEPQENEQRQGQR